MKNIVGHTIGRATANVCNCLLPALVTQCTTFILLVFQKVHFLRFLNFDFEDAKYSIIFSFSNAWLLFSVFPTIYSNERKKNVYQFVSGLNIKKQYFELITKCARINLYGVLSFHLYFVPCSINAFVSVLDDEVEPRVGDQICQFGRCHYVFYWRQKDFKVTTWEGNFIFKTYI